MKHCTFINACSSTALLGLVSDERGGGGAATTRASWRQQWMCRMQSVAMAIDLCSRSGKPCQSV